MPGVTVTSALRDLNLNRGIEGINETTKKWGKTIRGNLDTALQYNRALKLIERSGRDIHSLRPHSQRSGGYNIPGLAPDETARRGRFSPLNYLPQGARDYVRPSFRFGDHASANQYIKTLRNVSDNMAILKTRQQQVRLEQEKLDDANRRQGVSFKNLLFLMAKFGVAMEIIMLPGRIISGFMNIISIGKEWEQQLASINSLLNVETKEIYGLGRALSDIERKYGITGNIAEAAYEIASSLNQKLLDTAQSGMQGLGRETSAVVGFMDLGAKTAVAGITKIETALEGLIRVQSGFNLSLDETGVAANYMFKAIDKGLFNFEQLSPHIGEIVGGLNAVFGSGDTTKSLTNLKEMLAIWSTVSVQLPPHETVTALRRMLVNMSQLSSEGEKFVNWASKQGAKLRPRDVVSMSPVDYVEELYRTISPSGELTTGAVQRNPAAVERMGEENYRIAQSRKFIGHIFQNVRSAKAINALLANNMGTFREHVANMMKEYDALGKAEEKNRDTVQNMLNRLSATWKRIKLEMFTNLRDPLMNILGEVNRYLDQTVNSERFQKADFIGKVNIVFDDLVSGFRKWLAGGGRQSLANAFSGITEVLTTAIGAVLTNENMTMIVDVGIQIGRGLVVGLFRSLSGGILGATGGGIIGAMLGGPPGAVVGAIIGGFLGDTVHDLFRKEENVLDKKGRFIGLDNKSMQYKSELISEENKLIDRKLGLIQFERPGAAPPPISKHIGSGLTVEQERELMKDTGFNLAKFTGVLQEGEGIYGVNRNKISATYQMYLDEMAAAEKSHYSNYNTALTTIRRMTTTESGKLSLPPTPEYERMSYGDWYNDYYAPRERRRKQKEIQDRLFREGNKVFSEEEIKRFQDSGMHNQGELERFKQYNFSRIGSTKNINQLTAEFQDRLFREDNKIFSDEEIRKMLDSSMHNQGDIERFQDSGMHSDERLNNFRNFDDYDSKELERFKQYNFSRTGPVKDIKQLLAGFEGSLNILNINGLMVEAGGSEEVISAIATLLDYASPSDLPAGQNRYLDANREGTTTP